ncbi:hypothetical protein IB234_05060 [Pseudomonas sp. PDM16]|uniref:hypothetical protein n=1 Tax=Pseudomonas sp. PDM16 TaxID=2769292 RepID=UPI001780AFAF|nr:hypothetical protein [Pseudomonas sp. PDM16]MBD9413928.1 hypothetical protein [Pseudomonas sp. PDM16]
MKPAALPALGLCTLLSGCEAFMVIPIAAGCMLRPGLNLYPSQLPPAIVGQPYHVQVGVEKLSLLSGLRAGTEDQPLPEGLEFVYVDTEAHGVIQGEPTRSGTYEIRVEASGMGTQCSGQQVEQTYTLQVMERADANR